jgi:succinate dehydrogenase/fumarate reductase cytochrome b subunit
MREMTYREAAVEALDEAIAAAEDAKAREVGLGFVRIVYLGFAWSAMFHAFSYERVSIQTYMNDMHKALWKSHERCAETVLRDLASLGDTTAQDLLRGGV